MSRRYRHYITRPTRSVWPGEVQCVAAGPGGRVYVRMLVRVDNVYVVSGDHVIKSADEYWRAMTEIAIDRGERWLFSWRAAGHWSRLKLWEGIEDGEIQISEDQERPTRMGLDALPGVRDSAEFQGGERSTRYVPAMQDWRAPLIVCEDPPNIIRFGIGRHPGRFTWVDCRNYGVELVACDTEPETQVYQLSLFLQRMSAISATLNLGSLRPTAAGMALHAWRRHYAPRGVYHHDIPDALSLESAATYGGRCEAMRVGPIGEPIGHYDVRSEYGACMAAENVPVRIMDMVSGSAALARVRQAIDVAAIAEVTIETDEPAYPKRHDGLVIWPVGRFRTTLAGPELTDALLRHRIVAAHTVATYQSEPALASYARAIYGARMDARANGDDLSGQWLKHMLVALPGKLGQRNRVWVVETEPGPAPPYGDWWGTLPDGEQVRYRAIGGVVMREYVEGYLPEAVPAIAAWITSAGRMMLLRMIRTAGWNHTIYVDTDAIMVDTHGAAALQNAGYVLGDEMGQLRCVYRGSEVTVYGIKHYREGSTVRFAGAIGEMVARQRDRDRYDYILSPSTELRAKRKPISEMGIRHYPTGTTYRHGVLASSGRVTPHRLWEK